jgi:hypothetical protein
MTGNLAGWCLHAIREPTKVCYCGVQGSVLGRLSMKRGDDTERFPDKEHEGAVLHTRLARTLLLLCYPHQDPH